MKLEQQIKDLDQALHRLSEALDQPKNPFIRDAAILRFELVFELAWKSVQTLARSEALEVNSPRSAFQAAFTLGLTDDETVWPAILEARNLAVHTYHENLAEQLYESLPRFAEAFQHLAAKLKARGAA